MRGIANCDTARFSKPPSCSYWCDIIRIEPVVTRWSGLRIHRQEQITDPQWQRDVTGQTPKERKDVRRPHGGQPVGLNSKNYQGKTGLGHSMVVSQWSNHKRKVLRSPWLAAAPTWICRSSRTVRHPVRVRHGKFCSLQFCVHSLESAQILKFFQ